MGLLSTEKVAVPDDYIHMKKAFVTIIGLFLLHLSIAQSDLFNTSISVDYQNTPLKFILEDISKRTGIQFSYSSSKIPTDQTIIYKADQIKVSKLLHEVLINFPVEYQVKGNNRVIISYSDLKQTVRGVLKDIENQLPIFGANIIIVGTQPLLGASTNEDGEFRISNVPVGRHHLRVNYIGYKPFDTYILVGSGKEVVLNLEIKESVVELQEIVVTSNKYASQPKNDMAAVSARSFTMEETKRYAAAIGDPARLVTAYAGVVQADDGTNEIVIRGNSPRGLLWKMEGVEIPNPNHFSSEGASAGGISMFSTHMISQSDFFTGAFPSEYGNALSGVFDINLRKGNDEIHEKTFQIGLLGIDISAEGPFAKRDGSSYLFNYRYSTLGILDAVGLNLQDDTESNIFQDLSFKFNFVTEKAGNFSVFGLGGLSKYKENVGGLFNDLEIYNMGVIGVNHQIRLNKSTYLKSSISISGTHLEDEFEWFGDVPNVNEETSVFKRSYTRVSSTLSKKINASHFVEFGGVYSFLTYDFKSTEIHSGNTDPFKEIDRFSDTGNSSSFQGFASYKFQISDDLSLMTGLHSLHFAFTGETTFEPRAGLKWQFTPKQSFNLGFGIHSRIESLEYYLGRFINPDGSTSQFNTDLQITKSRHYVLGYDRILAPSLFMKMEVYYQELYDVPVIESVVGSNEPLAPAYSSLLASDGYIVYPLQNTGTGTNYGIELTIEKAFSNGYYFNFAGSLFESKYIAADGIERDTRFASKFNNSILAGKEFKVGRNGKNNTFGINIKSLWSGNQRYTPIDLEQSIIEDREVRHLEDVYTESYKNYYRLDFQLNYRINKPKHTSEWRLDIQNLTNRGNELRQYYDPGPQQLFIEEQLGLIPVLSYRIEF